MRVALEQEQDEGLDAAAADPKGSGLETPAAQKACTSAFRGVCWHRKSKKWQAAINSSGRHVYLGSFDTEEEAARMFDKVAIRVRGDKAKLNYKHADYQDEKGNIVQDSKLDYVVQEARSAMIDKQKRKQEAAAAKQAGQKRKEIDAGDHSDPDRPAQKQRTAGQANGNTLQSGPAPHNPTAASTLLTPSAVDQHVTPTLNFLAAQHQLSQRLLLPPAQVSTAATAAAALQDLEDSHLQPTILSTGPAPSTIRPKAGGLQLNLASEPSFAQALDPASLSKILAAVQRKLPPSSTLDCVIPCDDEEVIGVVYSVRQPNSVTTASGAGIWYGVAFKDLGTFSTGSDTIQACQGAMGVLKEYKHSLILASANEHISQKLLQAKQRQQQVLQQLEQHEQQARTQSQLVIASAASIGSQQVVMADNSVQYMLVPEQSAHLSHQSRGQDGDTSSESTLGPKSVPLEAHVGLGEHPGHGQQPAGPAGFAALQNLSRIDIREALQVYFSTR